MVQVTLSGVSKRFGETQVLHAIDAEIPEGAFVVLVGPSGCGKSTLLRLIAGLEDVTTGKIRFGDRDVTSLAPRDRDVAMVFQSYALYPHMSVRENLAFGLKLRRTDIATIERRVKDVARTLEIGHLLDRYPRQLSGGQRQRVAMGRAIVRRPALFMFDEPLSNLDPALRTQVRVDIRRLHDELGTTSVYVTHDQVEAMTLADVLFVLNEGVVQQVGAPLEIYQRPANRFVAGFLGSPAMNFVDGEITLDGVRFGEHTLPTTGFDHLEPGHEVTVGIRPHDVEVVTEKSAALSFELTLVETLGSHLHLHGEVAAQPFVIALEGNGIPKRGDRIGLRVRAFHIFDRGSGDSLRGE